MFRLVLSTLRDRLAATLALGVLATLAVASAVAVPLYAGVADRYAVESEFRQALGADRSIATSAEIPLSEVSSISSALDGLQIELRVAAEAHGLTTVPGAIAGGSTDGVSLPLVARNGYCAYLEIVAGECADDAGEVVVSDATAQRLRITAPGQTIELLLNELEEPTTLRVSGIYSTRVDPAMEPFWAGRGELMPMSLRVTNPLFTDFTTLDRAGLDFVEVTLDFVAAGPPWPLGDLRAVRGAVRQSIEDGYDARDGISSLQQRVEAARDRLRVSAPLGALTILLLSWCVLLLAASHLARGRQAETALGRLRGAPGMHRFLLTRGPTLLILLLSAPLGVALGWWLVRMLTGIVFDQPDPVELTAVALIAGGVVLATAMVGVSFLEGTGKARPLLEMLRGVPPRRTRSGLIVELAVAALAVAAIAQSITAGEATGVGVLAPLLAAAAIGLLATRLVRPAAAFAGRVQIQRGRIASGLAALQLARRPGAAHVVTLAVIGLVVTGHTADAWERYAGQAHDRAVVELGAQRVITVAAPTRHALLSAVHGVDPEGRWAMAVARERLLAGRTLVAVDTARLGEMVAVPDPAALSRLRPEVNRPIEVTGAELILDATIDKPLTEMEVSAVLYGPRGQVFTVVATIPAVPGRAAHHFAVPGCAEAPGCRLAWLSFPRSPAELRMRGLRQASPDREVVGAAEMLSVARWRTSLQQRDEVTFIRDAEAVSIRYSPGDPRFVSRDIRLQVADAPWPLPVIAAGDPSLAHTRELTVAAYFSGSDRPIEVIAAGPGLAGVPDGSLLADLELADRLGDTLSNAATLQVWLNGDAPADAVARLEAAGLIPIRTDSIDELAERYRRGGEGLGLWLRMVASGLAVALAMLMILVLAGTDRRDRAAELAALRAQGLTAKAVRRVIGMGSLTLIVAATTVSAFACMVVWWLSRMTDPGAPAGIDLPPLLVPLAGGLFAILITAWIAGLRLRRAVSRPELSREAGL